MVRRAALGAVLSTPTITAIIPTIGRESLLETLDSCLEADEIVVLADGPEVPYIDVEEDATYVVTRKAQGCHGHPLRNLALDSYVSGGYVVSIDDDDVFLPGAFAAIRAAIAYYPGRWFVFQMIGGPHSHFPGVVCWQNRRIRIGDVGTPMIVAPTSAKARWGNRGVDDFGRDMGDGFFGDYEYAAALQEELGDPVWLPVVIAEIRPAVIEGVL